MKKPLVLLIMDGFGLRDEEEGNAIKQANTPNLDKYFSEWPFTRLKASGRAVGLPKGFQGSSEVGHLNIGAGRVVKQEELMIDEAIEDGSFFNNDALVDAVKKAKKEGKRVHLMGLLSDKGVHSHINHLFALLKLCNQYDVEPYVHAFTDGRDTLPRQAEKYFKMLDEKLERYGGVLKTITGRYYAMDRDRRWDRTKLAFDAINEGVGEEVSSWEEALGNAYSSGENDEFIKPRVLDYGGLEDGDSVIFYNYRSDRPRQLTKALIQRDFRAFDKPTRKDVNFVGMVKYYHGMNAPDAFPKPHPRMGLGEIFSRKGKIQYRIAETEKYAHVTFFFSGEREEPYDGENQILIPSPKVATYDEKPEMSAYEITNKALDVLEEGDADLIVMNFANCDMVGHTGDMEATVKGVEAVDECIGKVADKALEKSGIVAITADHGNAETMLTEDGGTITSHSNTLVPFCIAGWEKGVGLSEGKLGDIAPTLLSIMDWEVPDEMTGDNLLQ